MFDTAAIPDYISLPGLLKATPQQEGQDRFVYLEASNETLDLQGESVLAKALEESSDYFLRFGNLDIDHFTQIGPTRGIPHYNLYEIGRPVDVGFRSGSTFVKGQIYSGEGPAAEHANNFWDSLTALNPPQRWYPSVGGSVLEKGTDIDPATKSRKGVIRKVRWSNIGFSKTPVNAALPTVTTAPFGPLAKSWGAVLSLAKALEAGYATDSAAMAGGDALRGQSLDQKIHSYWDFRDALAADMKARRLGANPNVRTIAAHAAKQYGLSPDTAAEWVERFYHDISTGLTHRAKTTGSNRRAKV